jgi:hypothetical protein
VRWQNHITLTWNKHVLCPCSLSGLLFQPLHSDAQRSCTKWGATKLLLLGIFILSFIIRNTYLVFVCFLANSSYNTWNLLSVFICWWDDWWHLDRIKMGAVHQKGQDMIRRLRFSAPLSILWGRRRTNDWVGHQSYIPLCLCNRASLKTEKGQKSVEFSDTEHMQVPGRWCIPKGHGSFTHLSTYLPYAFLPSCCSFAFFKISFRVNGKM